MIRCDIGYKFILIFWVTLYNCVSLIIFVLIGMDCSTPIIPCVFFLQYIITLYNFVSVCIAWYGWIVLAMCVFLAI